MGKIIPAYCGIAKTPSVKGQTLFLLDPFSAPRDNVPTLLPRILTLEEYRHSMGPKCQYKNESLNYV